MAFDKRWVLGLVLMGLVVFIWVFSSTLIQYIFQSLSFSKAFFLTYFDTSLFSLYLFGFAISPLGWWSRVSAKPSTNGSSQGKSLNHGDSLYQEESLNQGDSPYQEESLNQGYPLYQEESLNSPYQEESLNQGDSLYQEESLNQADSLYHGESSSIQESKEGVLDKEKEIVEMACPLSMWETVTLAAIFCPIWFVANYTFNLSLNYTSVSSGTILSSTSSFFTLLFGVIVKIEEFTWGKLLAVIFCIGGVALVSIVDEEKGISPLLGDSLALISAIAYGVYTVFLRKKITSEYVVSMPMFFGFVGLINMISLWPIFIILHFTGLEVFGLPYGMTLLSIFANGLIGTMLSDVIWSLVVIYTTALVATMGLSLTIPLAMITDLVMKKRNFDYLYIIGSVLVVLGFVLVNITSKKREQYLWYKFKSIFHNSNNPEYQSLKNENT